MTRDKLLGAVSMCRGAGKLAIGFDAALKAASKGAPLLLAASDAAERTVNNARAACGPQTEFAPIGRTQAEIEQATGRKFAVAAVCDESFARLIKQKIREDIQ